jgi:hypothetical protein
MPSDASGLRRFFTLLRSQGLGLLCAGATVLLLAIGTVIIAATRDGVSASVRMDDVTAFFAGPSAWHLWFYLLLPVLALYGLNTVLCTWHSLVTFVRAGVRSPSAYAPSVMHLAFLVALLAHGIGGIWGREDTPVAVDPSAWTDLAQGLQGRLVDVSIDRHPDGAPRQVTVRLRLRDDSGKERNAEISYNGPLSLAGGQHLLLLTRVARQHVAKLTDGAQTCAAVKGSVCSLGGTTLRVLGVYPSGHWGRVPALSLLMDRADQGHERFFLLGGRPHPLDDGRTLKLETVEQQQVALFRSRHAPGNPWALAAAAILLIGVVMMGRRWF